MKNGVNAGVRRCKLAEPALAEKVSELLSDTWSPEQISNRLKYENNIFKISTCTIYWGLEHGCSIANFARNFGLREDGVTEAERKANAVIWILNIPFTTVPKSVDNRQTIGHWESDTVRGAKWTGCIATHVERASRYSVLCKIPDRTADAFTQATVKAFLKIPKRKRRSFCADHGKEFANHREILQMLNCKVYFADPHAPWQRGTNENFNGLLRQFFPKRTSFAEVTQEDVEAVAKLLNRRPRKCLGWKTPEEVFLHKVLHLT